MAVVVAKGVENRDGRFRQAVGVLMGGLIMMFGFRKTDQKPVAFGRIDRALKQDWTRTGNIDFHTSGQAKEDDPYREAEPGKILHELRYGELAHFKLIPHTPYYGTAARDPPSRDQLSAIRGHRTYVSLSEKSSLGQQQAEDTGEERCQSGSGAST
jgi:hypothetical protein